jgi:hypothetical protein
MRLKIRVTVPGARAVSTASASGVASTVAAAGIAASSSPDAAAATPICDCGEALLRYLDVSLGAEGFATGASGSGCLRERAAPKPSRRRRPGRWPHRHKEVSCRSLDRFSGNRGALQAGETGAGFEASSGGIEDDPARNAKAVTGGKQFATVTCPPHRQYGRGDRFPRPSSAYGPKR